LLGSQVVPTKNSRAPVRTKVGLIFALFLVVTGDAVGLGSEKTRFLSIKLIKWLEDVAGRAQLARGSIVFYA
jgi:hypothetical protein